VTAFTVAAMEAKHLEHVVLTNNGFQTRMYYAQAIENRPHGVSKA
jgi:hypothetical protein